MKTVNLTPHTELQLCTATVQALINRKSEILRHPLRAVLLLKAAVPFPLADIHTEAVQAALAKHKEQKMALPMPTKRRSTFVQSPADACTPPGEAVPHSAGIAPSKQRGCSAPGVLLVLSQGGEVTSLPGFLKNHVVGVLGCPV